MKVLTPHGASAWMPRQYAHIAIVRRPEPHEFSGTGHHIGLNTARAKSGTQFGTSAIADGCLWRRDRSVTSVSIIPRKNRQNTGRERPETCARIRVWFCAHHPPTEKNI
jgi:hypothetical protein